METYNNDLEHWKADDTDTDESEEEEEFMFSDDFLYYDRDRIHPDIDCSKLSVLKMVLVYFLRHNLTLVALEDLLKLINCIIGKNSLFTSKYKFFKLFSKPYIPKNNFYCKHCYSDLEVNNNMYEENAQTMECLNCKKINKISSTTDNNFFVTYELEIQLKEVIEQNIYDFMEHQETLNCNNDISDINDGKLHKSRNVGESYHEVTLTLNTDGIQVFKSKNKSLWPIQFIINELPINKRFQTKNILVSGLWYDSKHPPMELFLKPVIKELITLKTTGLTVKYKKQEVVFNVSLICATLDAPAKSSVQNIVLFNGYDSCSYCEHPGELIDGYVKYPHQNCLNKRNHKDAVKQMLIAHKKNMTTPGNQNTKVKGFKGICPLVAAPGFDVINGFAIDYLHSICEGVVKHLLSLWFDTINHGKDFYIKPSIEKVNENIAKIQLPSEISRSPRSLKERHQWKANELRAWLLFYSCGALYGILKKRFLKHYVKLVVAVKIYLQEVITPADMGKAKTNIENFGREFESLYGKSNMRYNVHTISHIPDGVQNLGPLWAHSNFPFESNNGKLTNFVNAPKGVLHQICGKYSLSRVMTTPNFANTDSVKCFQKCVTVTKHFTTPDAPMKLLGTSKLVEIKNITDINVYKYIFDSKDFSSNDRFMLDNITFSTATYCKGKKCNDAVIKLTTDIYGEILDIITQKEEIYLILKKFKVGHNDIFASCPDFVAIEETSNLIVISANLIHYKCCIISLKNIKYLTPFNKFYDD